MFTLGQTATAVVETQTLSNSLHKPVLLVSTVSKKINTHLVVLFSLLTHPPNKHSPGKGVPLLMSVCVWGIIAIRNLLYFRLRSSTKRLMWRVFWLLLVITVIVIWHKCDIMWELTERTGANWWLSYALSTYSTDTSLIWRCDDQYGTSWIPSA